MNHHINKALVLSAKESLDELDEQTARSATAGDVGFDLRFIKEAKI